MINCVSFSPNNKNNNNNQHRPTFAHKTTGDYLKNYDFERAYETPDFISSNKCESEKNVLLRGKNQNGYIGCQMRCHVI